MAFYNIDSNISNFQIGFSWENTKNFTIWADGYRNAANSLAELLLSKIRFPDYEAYLVVFCYRHALELYMKGIIYDSIIILKFDNKENLISNLIKSHDLVLLFKKLKEILISIYPEDNSLKIEIKNMEEFIKEFSTIDKESFGFRYLINNLGKPNFSNTLLLNLESIKTVCNSFLEKFETISYMIEDTRSTVSDIISRIKFDDF